MTKITLTRKDLMDAVQKLQSVIPARPTLAILSNILFSIEGPTLTLTVTDVQMGVSVTLPVESTEKSQFTVLGKPFIDLVKTLSAEEVTLSLEGTELTLRSGTVTVVMQTAQADEFPAFPTISGEDVAVTKLELDAVLQKVAPSVSPDSARPLLTGVLFDPQSPPLAVATDGFRLSMLSLGKKESAWSERVVIPAKFFAEISKVVEKTVVLTYSSEQKIVLAVVGGTSLFSRTLEGEYPPYEKIIPASADATLTVSAADLLDQVKRAVIYSKESMNAVQIVATEQSVVIKAQSPTSGQMTGELHSAKFSGSDITIAFNSRYLLDYLGVVGDEEISIAMTDSLKPVLITASGKEDWRYVVMPFKLNS